MPAAAVASVTSTTRPGAAVANTSRVNPASTCTPSAISSTLASSAAAATSAAATGPAARWCSGGMALPRCVTSPVPPAAASASAMHA
jgi:hypothetical protein